MTINTLISPRFLRSIFGSMRLAASESFPITPSYIPFSSIMLHIDPGIKFCGPSLLDRRIIPFCEQRSFRIKNSTTSVFWIKGFVVSLTFARKTFVDMFLRQDNINHRHGGIFHGHRNSSSTSHGMSVSIQHHHSSQRKHFEWRTGDEE